jgi:hypothetical protein
LKQGENMDAQIFQFKDPDRWGPEFGTEVAHAIKDYMRRTIAPLEARIQQLEATNARLQAEIEQRNFAYMGVWKEGKVYGPGSFVTHSGAIWHCNQFKTTTRPGDGAAAWTLACKSGRDGKDGAPR